jgi:hypothetical protein
VKQKPRVVEEHDSFYGIISAVEAGTGVAIATDFGYSFGNRLKFLHITPEQNGQPFWECRNAFRTMETEENERLRRPIIECSIRLQRPASHMSQPLSFSQVPVARPNREANSVYCKKLLDLER